MRYVRAVKILREWGLSKDKIHHILKTYLKDAPSRSEVRSYVKSKPKSYFKNKRFQQREKDTLELLGKEGLEKLHLNYLKGALRKAEYKRVKTDNVELKRILESAQEYSEIFELEGS